MSSLIIGSNDKTVWHNYVGLVTYVSASYPSQGPLVSLRAPKRVPLLSFSRSQWPCLDFGNEMKSCFICLKKRKKRIRHVDLLESNVVLSALPRLRMNGFM